MIAKGTTHNSGGRLAHYMVTGKEGERAELWQLRGFASDDIREAFRSVDVMAQGTRCEQPFFHVQVRNPEGEALTRPQWEYTANRMEARLGLTGQARAISFHLDEKSGHEHMHVAWSRIDDETLTARPLPFFKDRLKKVSRELELHFGLTLVRNKRPDQISYAPTRAEDEQARRLGLDIHELRQTIRDCYERSDCGRSFDAALEAEGMVLAKGDKRDFIVIDPAGGMHAVGKRILDVSAAQIRKRLADLDREQLPSVEQAREAAHGLQPLHSQRLAPLVWDRDAYEISWSDSVMQAGIAKEVIERQFVEPADKQGAGDRKKVGRSPFEPPEVPEIPHWSGLKVTPLTEMPEIKLESIFAEKAREAALPEEKPVMPAKLRGTSAYIWNAYQNNHDAHGFAETLENEHGITLAATTKEEADRSFREASFAREIGNFAPRYREGEIVAVNQNARVYKLDKRTTGEAPDAVEKFLARLDRSQLPGIEAAKQLMHDRAAQREEKVQLFALLNPVKKPERDTRPTGRIAKGRERENPGRGLGKALTTVGKVSERLGGGIVEGVATAFDSLFGGPMTPAKKREIRVAARDRETEAEEKSDFSAYLAERERVRQIELEQEAARHRQRGDLER